MNKLIILDRDGVINYDSDRYIRTVNEFIPLPGSLEAISLLKKNGYFIAVATNQSGIARGYYTDEVLHSMHKKLDSLLSPFAAAIDHLEYCPHLSSSNCQCRKPLPGMLLNISDHFHLSLQGVPVIGDSLRDIKSALAVGASPYLVTTGKGRRTIHNCRTDLT
ncbi:MAG: D-glycero-beta-D-manno-heptose 1,7-bisphosphate 7-phosphatase, partial [Gammaproteobacteria bacterium]|nr:D-glycero-beta-D-manno-heptose 1,7-bisphosphate 7-phosphatase [Gammaproteobacteria bacterium]